MREVAAVLGQAAAGRSPPPGDSYEFPDEEEAAQLQRWQQQHEHVLRHQSERTVVRMSFNAGLLPAEPPGAVAAAAAAVAGPPAGDFWSGQGQDPAVTGQHSAPEITAAEEDREGMGAAAAAPADRRLSEPSTPRAAHAFIAPATAAQHGDQAAFATPQRARAGAAGGAGPQAAQQTWHTPPRLALFSPGPPPARSQPPAGALLLPGCRWLLTACLTACMHDMHACTCCCVACNCHDHFHLSPITHYSTSSAMCNAALCRRRHTLRTLGPGAGRHRRQHQAAATSSSAPS